MVDGQRVPIAGGLMKRLVILSLLLALATPAFPGFKPKNIRPKKPEQYQASVTAGQLICAADLLLEGKTQKDFFYKELAPSGIIAVRLAVFNNARAAVVLPLEEIRLTGPGGDELPLVAPETVAQAVMQGLVVTPDIREKKGPVSVAPGMRTGDPRTDRTDPRYDPRLDPSDPSYDPTDPRNRRYDDPRYGDPRYGDPRYGRYPRPGVDVVLNPRGGGGVAGDLSQFEKQLAEKDFSDKAHSADPIDGSMVRDRFLYFSLKDSTPGDKGFILSLPKSAGFPSEIVLKF